MNPVRTCLGCRERAAASSLVRVAVAHGKVVVDHTASLPGRGAWVHPATDCVDKALSRKTFGRALRSPAVIVDADALREHALRAQVATQQTTPREQAD